MKNLILLILFSTIFSLTNYAQNLKSNTLVRANKINYNVVGMEKFPGETLEFNNVFNKDNIYHGKNPKVGIDPALLVSGASNSSLQTAFMQTFSKERLQELTKERQLVFKLFFTPEGKVVEVEFLIRKDSSLTAFELEKLENALKQNVVYKVGNILPKGGDFFEQAISVGYKGILDNNL